MITMNEELEECILSLIDERNGVGKHIMHLKVYEETLINHIRYFKHLLKRRVNAESCKNAVDNLAVRIIMATHKRKRRELWNKSN